MATVSDATLALINVAVTDLAAAHGGDASAANLLVAAQSAQATADQAKTTALQLHTTATQSAIAAFAALSAELELPAAPSPTGPASPTPSIRHAQSNQHHLVTRALNLGSDWGTILRKLLEGGIDALQVYVDQLSASKR